MNWLTRAIKFGEKIKRVLKKQPTKEEIENSDWTSCCKGPVLKKELEENLWVCNSCGKHHRISCKERFDIFFGKNSYEILETPIPTEDPLEWEDTKTYKERLKIARKKTKQNCAVMIARGALGNPWIFEEIIAMWEGRSFKPVSLEDRRRMIEEHLLNLIAHFEKKSEYHKRRRYGSEQSACRHFRTHLIKYLKGHPGIGKLIKHLEDIHSAGDVMVAVDDVLWPKSCSEQLASGA